MAQTTSLQTATRRLHVLQVVGNAIVGGMETSVERLVERLPRERFEVTALCPFESPFTHRLRALCVDVVTATITDEPSWQAIHIACALVRASAIDVIQSHLPNAHVLAGIVGSLTRTPVLAMIHGRQITSIDLEVQRAAATHMAVVCRHSYLHALGCGVDPTLLHLVPNGVDTTLFAPGRPKVGALRRQLGIAADAPVVGFVGRLSWEKGPDVFLRTALLVHTVRPDAHFVLVGEGPMQAQLAALVVQFKLDDVVHMAGTRTDMPEVLGEFDVLVSSSHSEAMPLAVLEGMAAGLPIVACKVGGLADIVEQGVCGWLTHDGDYEGLSSRVLDLVQNPVLRRSAALAARERAVSGFDIGSSARATTGILEQLAQSGAAARHAHSTQLSPRPVLRSGATGT